MDKSIAHRSSYLVTVIVNSVASVAFVAELCRHISAPPDEICGRVFVSEPDFEFHNFTRAELGEVICGMIEDAKEAEVSFQDKGKLQRSIKRARNSEDLFEKAREALPDHVDVLMNGEEWGRHLMEYAWKHPQWYGKGSSVSDRKRMKDRPIIEAVYVTLTARRSNYLLTRETQRLDPATWQLVDR